MSMLKYFFPSGCVRKSLKLETTCARFLSSSAVTLNEAPSTYSHSVSINLLSEFKCNLLYEYSMERSTVTSFARAGISYLWESFNNSSTLSENISKTGRRIAFCDFKIWTVMEPQNKCVKSLRLLVQHDLVINPAYCGGQYWFTVAFWSRHRIQHILEDSDMLSHFSRNTDDLCPLSIRNAEHLYREGAYQKLT